MEGQPVRKIVIIGGGTAGWMAAATLSKLVAGPAGTGCELILIESPEIGTIGVGEATLPPIRFYNELLELAPSEFMRRTKATFKLGIEFRDWGRVGNRFFHGFGGFGPPLANRSAYSYWLRLHHVQAMPSYEEWSTATVMARQNRFTLPSGDQPSVANSFSFAFHFDAGLYADFLRDYAMQRGTQRIEGTVVDVALRPEDGFVAAVTLSDGRRIEGDLFVDCSGFRGLLIEQALGAGYDDWSAMLPCNRALAVPSESAKALSPYTVSTARPAGWQWRIPLQHRIGNGHVYCSGFTSDDEAARVLLEGLDTPALDQPRALQFVTGKRRRTWVKNVVAIGLSSGFLEPLESTSIQLIIDGVARLIELFPDRGFDPNLAAEYDRRMTMQYESIRDFIVLHYKLTQRSDSEFWRYCAAMPIPDTLAHQIELFRASGRVAILDANSFLEPSWVSIMAGHGIVPQRHDPITERMPLDALRAHFARLRTNIAGTVASMPEHAAYIERLLRPPG